VQSALRAGDDALPQHAGDDSCGRGGDDRIVVRRAAGTRVELVDELDCAISGRIDERRAAQRDADLVRIDDEHHEAREKERVRHQDGEAGHLPLDDVGSVQRDDGLDERRAEEPDHDLAGMVLEQRAHDPRRELPHSKLRDDERHRQHEAHQRDDRRGRRAEHLLNIARRPGQPAGNERAEVAIDERRGDCERKAA
jgi:hypothetical protein